MAEDYIDEMLEYELRYGDDDWRHFRERYNGRIREVNMERVMRRFVMAKEKWSYDFDIVTEKKLYRIIPPLARGSYMQRILEPEGYEEGDDPEWGCQLRWPMDDPEVQAWAGDMAKLFQKIFVDKFGKQKAAALLKNPNVRIPLRNGNNEANDEYEGWLFMNVRNKFRQPIIVGPNGKALPPQFINDQEIYSGAWYRSRVTLKHFEVKGHVVGAFIEGLMKVKDDERLDSVVNIGAVEEGFAAFADPEAGFGTAMEADDLAQAEAEDNPFDDSIPNSEETDDDDFSFLD